VGDTPTPPAGAAPCTCQKQRGKLDPLLLPPLLRGEYPDAPVVVGL